MYVGYRFGFLYWIETFVHHPWHSAYTHEPGRRGMALMGTRGLHLYLRTLEAAVEDEIVTRLRSEAVT